MLIFESFVSADEKDRPSVFSDLLITIRYLVKRY
jgi:hypothetical protein